MIAVGSWRGVGATTSALLLAAGFAAAGVEAWMVEADPAGGVLIGRAPSLRGTKASLAAAAFVERSGQLDEFIFTSRPFAGAHVFTGASDSFEAWSSVASARYDWVAQLSRLPGVCIVDVGSLRGGQVPTWSVLDIADAVVLVTSADPVSCMSTVQWAEAKGQSAPGVAGLALDNSRVLIVDAPITAGERFGPAVLSELGDRCAGWWPWEPRTVDAVYRGADLSHRSVRRTSLVQAVAATVVSLGAFR